MIVMQLQGPGSPTPVRRRKKSVINLPRSLSSIRRSIRSSLHIDPSSPTSPVRITSFFELGSPTILENDQPLIFSSPPIDVPSEDSVSLGSSHEHRASPSITSLDSPTASASSATSLIGSVQLQLYDEQSLEQPMKLLSVSSSSSSKEDMARSRALSFTTLRRRRSSKARMTRSAEVHRRSWELEDWPTELLAVPDYNFSRRNTYTDNGYFKNSAQSPLQPREVSPYRPRSPFDIPALSTMDDVLVDGLNPSKADRKKLEKINIHLHALFAAVEHGQLEKAKNILDHNSTQLDINSVNKDGSNVLEVAVMNNHVALAKMLQQAGATESSAGTIEQRIHHLNDLVATAERRREELDSKLCGGSAHGRETERQRVLWDRRVKMLWEMRTGLEQMKVPGPPSRAALEVIDSTRVRITFKEPEAENLAITTKYKVEWSLDEWATVGGCLEIYNLRRMSVFVDGLAQGKRHHFRVLAGNMKGYGSPLITTPPAAIPSSWRDADSQKPRLDGQVGELDDLFNQVCNSRPQHAAEIKAIEPGQETPLNLWK